MNRPSFSVSQGPDLELKVGLIRSLQLKAYCLFNFSRNVRLTLTKYQDNFSFFESSFYKGKYLISFVLAELVIFHAKIMSGKEMIDINQSTFCKRLDNVELRI